MRTVGVVLFGAVLVATAQVTLVASFGQSPAVMVAALADRNSVTSRIAIEATATPIAAAAAAASSTVPLRVYVNCSTGNDASAGSLSRPWRSLTPVRATDFPAGSTVHLAKGCTWNQTLEISAESTSTAGVVVSPYGTGARPVISGAGRSDPSPVSLLDDRIEVTGIAVTAAARYGIQMFGAHDVVRDVVVSHAGIAVRAMGAGDIVDRVQIRDLHMIVNTRGGNDDFGAVGVDVEAGNVEVARSSCTNCRAASFDFGHDGGFVEVWDHGDALSVHGNVATNTEGFIEIGGQGTGTSARNVRIVGNTMKEVHGGVFIHESDSFVIPTTNVLVSGNHITNRAASTSAVFGGYLGSLSLQKNVIIADQPIAFGSPWRHAGNVFTVPSARSVGFVLARSDSRRLL
jgi:hypothetical protein